MKFLLAKRNGSRCSQLITVSGNTFIIIILEIQTIVYPMDANKDSS